MHANAFATSKGYCTKKKEKEKERKNCLRIYKFNIVYAILYIWDSHNYIYNTYNKFHVFMCK